MSHPFSGYVESVFGCLESMGCTEVCENFFTSAASGRSDHDKLAYRNKVFHKLSRSFRYPEGGREEADIAEKAAEDTQTADRARLNLPEEFPQLDPSSPGQPFTVRIWSLLATSPPAQHQNLERRSVHRSCVTRGETR